MNNMLFNDQGELNASSVKDAFRTIAKLAGTFENVPSNAGLTSPVPSDGKRDELISRAMLTPEGKIALAQAMANPIK
jgi:hypothetical protein